MSEFIKLRFMHIVMCYIIKTANHKNIEEFSKNLLISIDCELQKKWGYKIEKL